MNCIELATDRIGYLRLQEIISCIRGPHRHELLERMSPHAVSLSEDPIGYIFFNIKSYSMLAFKTMCICILSYYVEQNLFYFRNYAMQWILKLVRQFTRANSVLPWKGSMWILARQKFSNYMVQKCLEDSAGRNHVWQDFVSFDELWQVARDRYAYGHHGLQKALHVAQVNDIFDFLFEQVGINMESGLLFLKSLIL